MSNITTDVYHRCYSVFLQCSEFDDHESLRAFFSVPSLLFLQKLLPQAVDKRDRVTKTLDLLQGKQLTDGTAGLVAVVDEFLQRTDSEDMLFRELHEVRARIVDDLKSDQVVGIPVVVAAMKQSEAAVLAPSDASENSIPKSETRIRFEKLLGFVQDHAAGDDLRTRYGPDREDWKIQISEAPNRHFSPIRSVVEDIAIHVNESSNRRKGLPEIYPQFRSSEFFDPDTRTNTWVQLKQSGCIIIVDAISLLHPTIERTLRDSGLVSHDHVAIFVHSPVNPFSFPVNGLFEDVINSYMPFAVTRTDLLLDKFCELGIGGIRNLRRWLSTVAPDVEDRILHPLPDPWKKEYMSQRYGHSTGIDSRIFWRS